MSSRSVDSVMHTVANLERDTMQGEHIHLSSLANRSRLNYEVVIGRDSSSPSMAKCIANNGQELAELLSMIANGEASMDMARTRFDIAGHLANSLYAALALCAEYKMDPLKLLRQKEAGGL